VDPNGMTVGFVSYDIGKLLHSTMGKYDFIQNYKYKLDALGQNKFNFSVQTNENHAIFSEILIDVLQNNINKLLMLQSYFACWSHMISLIPHHIKNSQNQALAFYLQSLIVGENFNRKLCQYENNKKMGKNKSRSRF
jgi:hypothetical protein